MTEYTVPTPETPESTPKPEAVATPAAKAAPRTSGTAKKAAPAAKKAAKKATTTAKKTVKKTTATAKKAATTTTKPGATAKATASTTTKLLEVPVTRMRSLLAELPEPSAVKSRVEGELLVASKAVEDLVAPVVALVTERTAEGRKAADSIVRPYVTTVVEKSADGRRAVEEIVGPMFALVAEKSAERRKAADAAVAPYLKSLKPYVATAQAQAGDAVKAAESVVEDLRTRADARAAFATHSPVVTEIRERTDRAVAEVRKVVGR